MSAEETQTETLLPQAGDWKSYSTSRGTRYKVWKINSNGVGQWVNTGNVRPTSGRQWTGKLNYISNQIEIKPDYSPLASQTEKSAALRWPADAYVNQDTDYIMF